MATSSCSRASPTLRMIGHAPVQEPTRECPFCGYRLISERCPECGGSVGDPRLLDSTRVRQFMRWARAGMFRKLLLSPARVPMFVALLLGIHRIAPLEVGRISYLRTFPMFGVLCLIISAICDLREVGYLWWLMSDLPNRWTVVVVGMLWLSAVAIALSIFRREPARTVYLRYVVCGAAVFLVFHVGWVCLVTVAGVQVANYPVDTSGMRVFWNPYDVSAYTRFVVGKILMACWVMCTLVLWLALPVVQTLRQSALR
jgi:hypothetical protein